jgi:hypothetical protein
VQYVIIPLKISRYLYALKYEYKGTCPRWMVLCSFLALYVLCIYPLSCCLYRCCMFFATHTIHGSEKTYYTCMNNKIMDIHVYATHTVLRREHNTIRSIKEKLTTNNAMVVKSDKSNSIIVVYQQDYQDKLLHINSNNKSEITNKKPHRQISKNPSTNY